MNISPVTPEILARDAAKFHALLRDAVFKFCYFFLLLFFAAIDFICQGIHQRPLPAFMNIIQHFGQILKM